MPWALDENCPCGRPFAFRECCKRGRIFPAFELPDIRPPGPVSDFSHEKCYLAFTNNCSREISREHYISKNALQLIPDLQVSGLPWLEPGERRRIGINSLTSKILCQRHNHSLEAVDRFGGLAIRSLLEAVEYLQPGVTTKKSAYTFFSGHMLQLWALKVLLGLIHSSMARDNTSKILEYDNRFHALVFEAFYEHVIPPPAGLYVRPVVEQTSAELYAFAPLISDHDGKLMGLVFKLKQFELWFPYFLNEKASATFEQNISWYRPMAIDLIAQKRSVRALLDWPPDFGTYRKVDFKFGK